MVIWLRKMIRRITVDLDTLDESELSHALKVLEKNGFIEKIQFEISPSGKGWHIVAWHKKGVTKEKLLTLRAAAGDDATRIKLDAIAGRQINVLFDWKQKKIIRSLSDQLILK